MANEKNLTLMGKAITSTEQAQAMGSKGGSVVSPRKKYAAKIREMKKRKLKDSDVGWFLERLEDPETNMFHLTQWLDQLREHMPLNYQRTLLDTAINLHKAHHGEKHKNENTNININIDVLKFDNLATKYSEE